MRYTTNN